jgi:hypothetical protein
VSWRRIFDAASREGFPVHDLRIEVDDTPVPFAEDPLFDGGGGPGGQASGRPP